MQRCAAEHSVVLRAARRGDRRSAGAGVEPELRPDAVLRRADRGDVAGARRPIRATRLPTRRSAASTRPARPSSRWSRWPRSKPAASRPTPQFTCPGYLELGNATFHCWQEGRPRHAASARRDQEFLRRLFLRDRAAHRHRPHRRDGQALRLWRPARHRHPGRARRADPDARLEAGDDRRRLAAGRDTDRRASARARCWRRRCSWRRWRRAWPPAARSCRTWCASNGAAAAGRRSARLADFAAAWRGPRITSPLVLDGMNAVVNEQGGTAYAARIKDPALAMGGKIRHLAGPAHHARTSATTACARQAEIPWKERDHALFVAFAPVGAPRYVCAVVVEHGGAEAAAAARRWRRRSAATSCSRRSSAIRRAAVAARRPLADDAARHAAAATGWPAQVAG